jgi:hypothetical protein
MFNALPRDRDTEHRRFEVGQVWYYHFRKGEDESTLTIVKIESYPRIGAVIHIVVDGVCIANPKRPNDPIRQIDHMPFGDAALEASITELAGHRVSLPAFEQGYHEWREAFEEGQAGMFIISVAEAIDFLEQSLRP